MTELIHKTVGQLLQDRADDMPGQEAVVYSDRGLRYTYKEFNQLCEKVARGIMALSIDKGEHVAVWGTNTPEWLTLQYATGKMGAVLVTVNTSYRANELEYLLKQSDSTTIFLIENYRDHSYIDTLYEICPELHESIPGELNAERLPSLKNVVIMGEKRYPGAFHWNDIIDKAEEISREELIFQSQNLDPNDVINMQYTSGTTGFPKGVMLTHRNLTNNGFNIANCMKLTAEDRLCIPVPFFHCFGCVIGTLAAVSVGATMIPIQEFEPEQVLKTVEQESVTALHGVPTMFIAELNHPNFERYNLSSLRTGVMAGSNCPVEVMKNVMNKMNMSEITICYGQTESSPVITQTRANDPIELRVESVGKALPNVEVKIIDPATNEELPHYTQGELCTRGYHVMKGYYKNPEATQRTIDEDGWLHTGDLAIMDDNGYCKITGRLKDMIIRGGENIYPREIEELLYKHPKILDAQVVGVPDEKFGEEVHAWIILKEGEISSSDEIKQFCNGQISKYKIPKHIFITDAYPMTASGKIQKFKLREKSLNEVERKI
ncbi:long-chain fatty-acid-CoA ligase [Oceanobacillus iheyensis HTE831]|uniref:Long-chain fatty-acid-CoA ligase n=1 Tax=Oceanobacillus iheyensis (strain DSM 14371 / CIP 107618 / JCM 11309 / KCTC 3954 / HTE831) TaxID=221109 RepID=Q8EP96_OCEIH|nr:AMP-binding protein [Oceanobacillus iheyensis]BAC14173.1 long-chain fatty-acid-CoA ligase [Oceanobacillus iheyensis HTE831]